MLPTDAEAHDPCAPAAIGRGPSPASWRAKTARSACSAGMLNNCSLSTSKPQASPTAKLMSLIFPGLPQSLLFADHRRLVAHRHAPSIASPPLFAGFTSMPCNATLCCLS